MVYAVGIDLGGTNIGAGVVDEEGRIIAKEEVPTGVGRPYEEIMKDMAGVARSVVGKAGLSMDDIGWIGVGAPGVADNDAGEVVFANNLFWHHVPVRRELRKYIDKPAYIENDANVAMLAEYACGVAKDVKNAILLTLGTGLGGGIIIDGKIYGGTHHVGAEIGHMCFDVDGIACNCGNVGCWERYASATALIRMGAEAATAHPESLLHEKTGGDSGKMTAKIVIDAAKDGDAVALEVFNRYIYYVAMGMVSLINTFDPEMFVIGGGVSKAGDFLLHALREKMQKHIFYKDQPYATIELSVMGNDAGIIGAAMLGR